MRRRLIVLVSVSMLIASACSSGGDEEPTSAAGPSGAVTGNLTLFGYEDNFVPEVIDPFLEANPDLDVQTAVFGSNDEAVTKLQNGFQADIINVCTEETRRMVDLGLLQPIDTSRIDAWDTIFPALKEQTGVVVDGEVYMIPNVGGTSGRHLQPRGGPAGDRLLPRPVRGSRARRQGDAGGQRHDGDRDHRARAWATRTRSTSPRTTSPRSRTT